MGCKNKLLIKYSRLSLEDDNEGESGSIINQRHQIDDYIEEHEELQEMESLELSDDGYTGTNFNRPGMKRFLELLKANKVGCLIVKDFSRFTRDYIELGNYIEQIFPFMEVRFIAINDHYDSASDTQDYSLEVPFKGMLNDLYSKDISVKSKAAKRLMIKKGKLCSGSYPFGYRKVVYEVAGAKESPYLIDEEAAGIVRHIFDLALAGKSNIEIARELNVKNYPTPGVYKRRQGSFGYGLKEGCESIWDSPKVLSILRDERYKGTLILGRYQSAGVGSGKVVKAPKENWFRKECAIPAIISETDFNAVQALRPQKKGKEHKRGHHMLYRKVKCGCCGRYLYFKPSKSGDIYNSFFCIQSHLKQDSLCFRGYVKEDEIINMLLCVIQKQVDVAEKIKESAGKQQAGIEKQKIERIERRLCALEKEIEWKKTAKGQRYLEYKEGVISKEEFLEQKYLLQQEIDAKEKLIEKLDQERNTMQKEKSEFVENFNGYGKIERLDREMIEKLVDVVWVYDVDRVKVDLRFCEN